MCGVGACISKVYLTSLMCLCGSKSDLAASKTLHYMNALHIAYHQSPFSTTLWPSC